MKGRKRLDAWHRNLMWEYRTWRDSFLSQREYLTCGYATEVAEYNRQYTPPTFRQFLEGRRRW